MTDDEIKARHDRLGEGWRWIWWRCPVANALLKQWILTLGRTFKDVAQDYSRHQLEAAANCLDFNPVALKLVRDGWPVWRDESPNICDSEAYQRQEAQRVCNEIYATMCAAMSYRSTHEKMKPCATVTVTREQAKALGFDV